MGATYHSLDCLAQTAILTGNFTVEGISQYMYAHLQTKRYKRIQT